VPCSLVGHVKWVHYHHGMVRPRVADRRYGLQIWRVAANILNKQSRTADSGWSSSLGVGREANNPPRKTQYLLHITTHSLGTGRITWHKLSTGKWKERDHLEDQDLGGKMESEWILGRLAWGVWIGFDWLRTGTGGGLLWVLWWTLGFIRHGVS
jgi:hypothetical protein